MSSFRLYFFYHLLNVRINAKGLLCINYVTRILRQIILLFLTYLEIIFRRTNYTNFIDIYQNCRNLRIFSKFYPGYKKITALIRPKRALVQYNL